MRAIRIGRIDRTTTVNFNFVRTSKKEKSPAIERSKVVISFDIVYIRCKKLSRLIGEEASSVQLDCSSVARAGRKETVVSVLLSTLGARSFPNYDRSRCLMEPRCKLNLLDGEGRIEGRDGCFLFVER